MSDAAELETGLTTLAGLLQEPFRLSEEIESAMRHPAAERLLAGGTPSADRLLAFLRADPPADLARVAAFLLSRLDPEYTYRRLLEILAGAGRGLILAIAPGFWKIPRDPRSMAEDVVRVAEVSGNPEPLLLLQHPAAAAVKPQLQALIRGGEAGFAEHATSAYGYALQAEDIPFLSEVAQWTGRASISAPAGVYLLRLGSSAGWTGILAGLNAADEDRRVQTYTELYPLLPVGARDQVRFNPRASAEARSDAIQRIGELMNREH